MDQTKDFTLLKTSQASLSYLSIPIQMDFNLAGMLKILPVSNIGLGSQRLPPRNT